MSVAVLMTGCSGDPEPVVTPSPTPTETVEESPSPTPTPSATALTEEEILAAIPEAARTEDFPGAQSFTEFFVNLFPTLFQEGAQPELFEALSGPDCLFCQDALENASIADARGDSTRGGEFAFADDVAQGGLRETGEWLVERRFEVSDTDYVDTSGTVFRTTPGGSGLIVARLSFSGGAWTVEDIAFEYDDE